MRLTERDGVSEEQLTVPFAVLAPPSRSNLGGGIKMGSMVKPALIAAAVVVIMCRVKFLRTNLLNIA